MIDTFGRLSIMVWQVELLVDFLSVFGYSLNNFLPSNSTLIYEISLASRELSRGAHSFTK
jgi:hypothetical protein